jgi:hypothetical protein
LEETRRGNNKHTNYRSSRIDAKWHAFSIQLSGQLLKVDAPGPVVHCFITGTHREKRIRADFVIVQTS